MCGRFTLRTPGNVMIEQFSLDFQGELFPRYNIAPTQRVPVVRGSERKTSLLAWGLVPFWAKNPKSGSRMINARSETVATKPAFRHAFKKKRCLVPADGYFEWIKEGKRKQPYWIRMQDEQPFLMAGLWECWRDKSVENPESLETFTLLTTESNSLTMEVHDRMPVILRPNDYDRWLDPELTDADELSFLFEPFDPNEMQLDPVNDRVNSVRNDDEECILIEPELF
jgi:putative SOS response-associated peptidase YedK